MKIAYCGGWCMLSEVGKFRSLLGFGSMRPHTAALIYVVCDDSTHTHSRSELFRNFTQRGMELSYRHFGSTYRSQLQRSRTLLGLFYLEAGANKLSRNVGKSAILRWVKSEKSADLLYTVVEAWKFHVHHSFAKSAQNIRQNLNPI